MSCLVLSYLDHQRCPVRRLLVVVDKLRNEAAAEHCRHVTAVERLSAELKACQLMAATSTGISALTAVAMSTSPTNSPHPPLPLGGKSLTTQHEVAQQGQGPTTFVQVGIAILALRLSQFSNLSFQGIHQVADTILLPSCRM